MKLNKNHLLGVTVFTVLFPAMHPILQYIPNPMVPGAIISLNMILPVLAGYFYGPLSGLVVGGCGTLLAALVFANPFYVAGVFSMALAGALAGWTGKRRRLKFPGAATILAAHALNILVLLRIGLLAIPPEKVGVTILGLASETVIDILATLLAIEVLGRWLYRAERW